MGDHSPYADFSSTFFSRRYPSTIVFINARAHSERTIPQATYLFQFTSKIYRLSAKLASLAVSGSAQAGCDERECSMRYMVITMRSLALSGLLLLFGCGGLSSRGTPTPPPNGTPQFGHVFLVVEENHSYSDVIGNSQMPYLNNLPRNTVWPPSILRTFILHSAITSC